MTTEELDEEGSKLYFIMVVIILIMSGSLIYQFYSFQIAFVLSLLIWALFGGALKTLLQTMQRRKAAIEQNLPLSKFCTDCGLEIGIDENECMYCQAILIEST